MVAAARIALRPPPLSPFLLATPPPFVHQVTTRLGDGSRGAQQSGQDTLNERFKIAREMEAPPSARNRCITSSDSSPFRSFAFVVDEKKAAKGASEKRAWRRRHTILPLAHGVLKLSPHLAGIPGAIHHLCRQACCPSASLAVLPRAARLCGLVWFGDANTPFVSSSPPNLLHEGIKFHSQAAKWGISGFISE